ncbi:MAG: C39 family peptidase [Alphaproteobacteria bacterium]
MALGIVLASAALWVAAPADAGTVEAGIAGLRISVPVTSLREARFATVVRQRYDFSCGSAAVATLLTHHYGRPTDEEQAFAAMFQVGNQDDIRRYGFSLLDMQNFLAMRGLRADGFRITLDELAKIGVPAITLISIRGYKHFVVVKGTRDGHVLVGDPALGLKVMRRGDFEEVWDRVMFVVRDDIEPARTTFNRDEEWRIRRRGPLAAGVDRRGLAGFSLLLPRLNEF